MLEDKEFCVHNSVKMRINSRTGHREADLPRYFFSLKDFACQSNGEPYHHDHEDAMKADGGGRIKRRAFERVFGTAKTSRFELLPRWACNEWSQPEEE